MVRVINVFLVAVLAAFGGWTFFGDELVPADRKILFVGNSFTFGGDVPGQVRRLAASAETPVSYHTRMIAKPAYRLSQHIREGAVQKELGTGVWDVIVIQDASSAALGDTTRRELQQSAAILADAARQADVSVVYFSHWSPGPAPLTTRADNVTRIERTYRAIARQTGGRVAPVGRTWVRARSGGVQGLYADDQHHASDTGAFAAALTILSVLGDVAVETTHWHPDTVSRADADTLRRIAAR